MKFKTHNERMQHPQAQLIPRWLWKNQNCFNKMLPDCLLPMMMAKDSDVLSVLTTFSEPKSNQEKRCVWVAIALSHPQLSTEVLVDMGLKLGMSDKDLFIMASEISHYEFLSYLKKKSLKKFVGFMKDSNYRAFQRVAKNGHPSVAQYLLQHDGTFAYAEQYMQKYSAHVNPFVTEKIHTLRAQKKALNIKRPGEVFNIQDAQESKLLFYVLKNLIRQNDEELRDDILFLLNIPSVETLLYESTTSCHENNLFRFAVSEKNQIAIELLLAKAKCFAYAEEHVREYSAYVNPFLSDKIHTLRIQKDVIEAETPNAIFNIENGDEAELLFYVARNIIRRNEPSLQDDLLFLLTIPSVRALAHRAVTIGQANDLLQLAFTVGNQGAAELLLNIPAVRNIAERNNYYREEQRGGLDLRALAQNRESSMMALSQGERERLEEALNRYQPMIKASGVEPIMNELRNTLISRYEKNPAKYKDSAGVTHALPLYWDDFQALQLKGESLKSALEAYAKHKDHSAWRYLSKPNPWMHEHASYVYVNPDNPHEKWSTFEEYQPEICLYYLGAIDEQSPPTDGYTLETRLEGFIHELALIGRAHNWDKQRYRFDADGDVQHDEGGNAIMEEYDDLEKDRPSCFSGVMRRLFQSVRGHSLFTLLTADILQQQINELVRQHIEDTLNHMNGVQRDEIKTAWHKVIEGEFTAKHIAVLRALDVPIEKQNQWAASMSVKYGRQFTNDPALVNQMKTALAYKANNDAQVLNFGHVHPEALFEDACFKDAPRAPGRAGLFGDGGGSNAKNQKDEPASPSPVG